MKEHVEVFWFSEQPYGHVTDADLATLSFWTAGFSQHLFRSPQSPYSLQPVP